MLTCKTGGFVTLRHNEIVNVTADMLSMVYKDVKKEPALSTTPDSNDEFRTDICWCKGFLPARSKLSEPVASNNDKDNGKPEKKKMQSANLRLCKWLFHSPCIYNQWWDEHENKTIL